MSNRRTDDVCQFEGDFEAEGVDALQAAKGIRITFLASTLVSRPNQIFDRAVLNRLCSTLHCKPKRFVEWKPDRFPREKKEKLEVHLLPVH